MIPRLQEVEKQVDALLSKLLSKPGCFVVVGRAGSGKSTLLELLAERLTDEGRLPLRAVVPDADLDAPTQLAL